MKRVRVRAAMVAAVFAAACTTTHVLRTAPTPGMLVRVDFVERRNIDVHVGDGRTASDSVPYDGISTVTGRVARTNGDTLWLGDVYVDSAGKQVRPGPNATMRVTGVGRDAEVREVRFNALDTTVGLLGLLVGVAAIVLVLALVIGPGNST